MERSSRADLISEDSHPARTHTCGDLRAEDNGEAVVLKGWGDTRRNHGGLAFGGLRDPYRHTPGAF